MSFLRNYHCDPYSPSQVGQTRSWRDESCQRKVHVASEIFIFKFRNQKSKAVMAVITLRLAVYDLNRN